MNDLTTLDLYQMEPHEIRALLNTQTDPLIINILFDLEAAVATGDELSQMQAIEELTGLLVYERQGEMS